MYKRKFRSTLCRSGTERNGTERNGTERNGTEQNIIHIVSLDDWATDRNITKLDFIKADIEGFERYMLEGAQQILRKFEPKLSLCTYHCPDDPEVLEALILKANPKYKIIQRKMKLFAFVP
ncbi:MAG: FkbM family methyltransferase [Oscillospiraceae bacterium]|nr:FkbM family methyltransferase [Oscillospiraceae bacterium]